MDSVYVWRTPLDLRNFFLAYQWRSKLFQLKVREPIWHFNNDQTNYLLTYLYVFLIDLASGTESRQRQDGARNARVRSLPRRERVACVPRGCRRVICL